MRRRRAERLALRAQAAADAGCWEDARTCIAEARALSPGLPKLDEIERELPGFVPPADIRIEPAQERATGRRRIVAAAIVAVAATAAVGGWFLTGDGELPNEPAPVVATTAPSSVQPPEPALRDVMPAPATVFATETAAAPVASPPLEPEPVREPSQQTALSPPPAPERQESAARITGATAARSAGTTGTLPVPRTEPVPDRSVPPPPAPSANPASAGAASVAASSPAAPSPERSVPDAPSPVAVLALPAAPAAAPPAPVPPPVEPSQEPAVRMVLNSYASAYSALDADAAKRVWPGVNRSALADAFDSLASQRVDLGDCQIDVAGTSARATCAGTATWSPKIGGGGRHSESRRWSFELARGGSGWEIVSARVQNR